MDRRALLASLALLATACEPTLFARSLRPPPRITAADVPPPAIVGSTIRITGTDLDRLGELPSLSVGLGGGRDVVLFRVESRDHALHFEVSRELVETLGAGETVVTLVAEGEGVRTDPYPLSLAIATALPIVLGEGLTGDVHRNDRVVLDGDGFLSPSEGELVAHVVGTFTPEGGSAMPLDAEVPVELADRTSRTRGVVILTTALGGNRTGDLDGTITLRSAPRTLAPSESDAMPVAVRFLAPELYAFDPAEAALGRIVRLRGAGFLGDAGTETTLVRIDGTFTPDGGSARAWSMELVPSFESGQSVSFVVEARVSGETLVASLFGAARGTLEGIATPITTRGVEELTGSAAPFRFTLGAPHQVVLLRFLPGYYDSLARFGLAAAEDEVEARIVDRIHRVYAGLHVEVVTEVPEDWDPRHYAIVEIGGPDPNGNGLFGYDNSPGKDVGNLRLFDRLGGENAETQEDGFPGYGGVFVESLLWWSSHPDLPGDRPPSSPPADPLFDDMFDPVRRTPVTQAELLGDASPARAAEIERAIRALSSIIGETTAHELGHSLGLAQPLGELTAFHNDSDGDGCLMDRGGDRPLGERAEEPGYAATRLCYDEPAYLAALLGD